MTGISTQNSFDIAVANGVTAIFNFTFFAYTTGQIKVYTIDGDDDPVDVTGSVTVALNSSFIGGTATFSPAPALDLVVLIQREVAYTQETEFADITRYKETAIEEALNTLEMQIQQVKDVTDRSISFSQSSGVTNPFIGTPVDTAVLVFDGVDGRIIAGPLTTDIAAVADHLTEIDTVAGSITNVNSVASNATNINSVAAIAANVTTVAGIAANVTSVAGNATNINTVATNITDVQNAQNNANIAKAAGGFTYTYSSTTTAADPGSGLVRFNNATLASATAMYISETTGLSQSIAAELATWDDSTSTIHSRVRAFKQSDPSVFAIFNVTGTMTDNGSWDTFTVAYVGGSGSISNGDVLTLQNLRTGDKGDTGATGPTGTLPFTTAGGTGNAITANFTPDITLTDGQLCIVRAGAANSGATTFTPDGLTTRSITKNGGTALSGGEIPSANFDMILIYDLANTRWEILNPVISGSTAPTRQVLTSGSSATYTTPAGCKGVIVRMVGGGGGGGGSSNGSADGGGGGTGGTTSFGSWTAIGGSGGASEATTGNGGAGGTGGTSGTGTTKHFPGSGGGAGNQSAVTGTQDGGGLGANSPFGGAGVSTHTTGNDAAANSGSGGSGANNSKYSSGGGGAGEYVETLVAPPAASYTYTIGAGGAAGLAGTAGRVGGAGGSGIVIVDEFY